VYIQHSSVHAVYLGSIWYGDLGSRYGEYGECGSRYGDGGSLECWEGE
jgi:hypothetical protein